MFDCHMHSIVSFDGHDSGEMLAQAAKNAGLKEICFTDHVDVDPRGVMGNMEFDIDAYKKEYANLRIDGLTIRRGMEFGLLEDNQAHLKQRISLYDFDFVLGSIHFVDGWDVYFKDYWNGKTVFEARQRYLEQMLTCVKSHDDFDVLAHLTYLNKSPANPDPVPLPYSEHREVIDEVLRTLVQKGKGLEMNTSGVDRCGGFLPTIDYFKRFKELGGEIVTVGSDAHTAGRVGQYCADASALLADLFGYVCTFRERKPVFHKL